MSLKTLVYFVNFQTRAMSWALLMGDVFSCRDTGTMTTVAKANYPCIPDCPWMIAFTYENSCKILNARGHSWLVLFAVTSLVNAAVFEKLSGCSFNTYIKLHHKHFVFQANIDEKVCQLGFCIQLRTLQPWCYGPKKCTKIDVTRALQLRDLSRWHLWRKVSV